MRFASSTLLLIFSSFVVPALGMDVSSGYALRCQKEIMDGKYLISFIGGNIGQSPRYRPIDFLYLIRFISRVYMRGKMG